MLVKVSGATSELLLKVGKMYPPQAFFLQTEKQTPSLLFTATLPIVHSQSAFLIYITWQSLIGIDVLSPAPFIPVCS